MHWRYLHHDGCKLTYMMVEEGVRNGRGEGGGQSGGAASVMLWFFDTSTMFPSIVPALKVQKSCFATS